MRFQCIHCSGIVAIDDTELGQHVGCGHCDEVVQVPDSKFSPQSVIDDFVLETLLGRGGMGIVYKAHQQSLDRPVALKILMNEFSAKDDFIIDFIREARAAARLNHPYIVQAYAVGQDDDTYFLAMEFVEGKTLKQIMDVDGTIPLETALTITLQITEALEFAWNEQKLIHRDIKPDNIMITQEGVAKLMDLGLSRFDNDKLAETEDEDEVMGTPQYICPEQLIGMSMDVRGDLYSLGATLYHALTGEFPFEGRNAAEIAKKHLQEPLVSASVHNPSLPTSVCALIDKLMAKHPDDRYATPQELIRELSQIKASLSNPSKTSKSNAIRFTASKTNNKAKSATGAYRKTDPSSTDLNRASRTDRNRAVSTGRNKASNTGRNKASNTGRNKASNTGRNKASNTGRSNPASTGRNKASNTGTSNPASTGRNKASNTGRSRRPQTQEEGKYANTTNPAMLYGTVGTICAFLIAAIILMIK